MGQHTMPVGLSKGASLVAGGVHRNAAVPCGQDGPQRLHIQDGVRRQSKHLHTQPAAVSRCVPGGCRTHARPAQQHKTRHRWQ